MQGLHLSSPYEVRRLVTDLTWPREDVAQRLASPDFPGLLLRDPDVARVVRRSGGMIALNGVPLTTAGWRRVRQRRRAAGQHARTGRTGLSRHCLLNFYYGHGYKIS